MKSIKYILFFCYTFLIFFPANGDEPFKGWLETSTRHFKFIYEERDTEAVQELLYFCEDIYSNVTALLDWYPGKIECIIRGRTDSANGFFSPLPNRLELFVAPPSLSWFFGSGTENWLKLLLIHELTHYVHMTKRKGIPGIAGTLFSPSLLPILIMVGQPGWSIEGITTNTETMFTAGGRGRNPYFEMYYKAPVVEKRLFTFKQAAYSSAFPPFGRHYVAGYIMVDYLLTRYGEDSFRRIHDDFLVSFGGSFRKSIRDITTRDMELIFRNMQGDLMIRYRKEMEMEDGIRLSPRKNGYWFLPHITDRGWYLYRFDHDNRSAIVLYDPGTGKETPLVKTPLTDYCSFTTTKDGGTIVFSHLTENTNHPAGSHMTADLYRFYVDDKKTEKLTDTAHLWQPVISPDGQHLFAVQRYGSYSRIVEIDMQTGGISLLFSKSRTTVYNPALSPSGDKIVFVMNRQGMQDLYMLDLNTALSFTGEDFPEDYNTGKITALLGNDYAGEYNPCFIDEETILFSSDREGSLKLYSLDVNDPASLSLRVEDRIGAYAGVMDGDDLIYASYSSEGYCLKKPRRGSPGSRENWGSLPVKLPVDPAGFPFHTGSFNVKKHFSAPKLLFWLPYPALLGISFPGAVEDLSDFTSDLGVGLIMQTGSLLGNHYGMVNLNYFPAYQQLTGSIGLYCSLSNLVALNYSIAQSFVQSFSSSEEAIWSQLTVQQLFFSFPLVTSFGPGRRITLGLNTGLGHAYKMSAGEPFSFMNAAGDISPEEANILFLTGDLNLQTSTRSAMSDLYGSNIIKAKLGSDITLPFLDQDDTDLNVTGAFSWLLPVPGARHNVKTGFKGGWQNSGDAQELVRPRGNNVVWNGEATDVHGLVSLEYLYAFPLLDETFLGFNLQALGMGIHLEGAGGYSFDNGFQTENAVYLGVELAAQIGYNVMSLPVGAGVNMKVDGELFSGDSTFSRFYFYLFAGFDSFL